MAVGYQPERRGGVGEGSTTTRTPTTAPPDQTDPGIPHAVVYPAADEGRAISILYLDGGGVLQAELSVQPRQLG
jgi:hypothetical protein